MFSLQKRVQMQQHEGRSWLHSTKDDTRSLKYKQTKRVSRQTAAKVNLMRDKQSERPGTTQTQEITPTKIHMVNIITMKEKTTVRKVQLTLVKYIFCVIFVGRQIFFQIWEGEHVHACSSVVQLIYLISVLFIQYSSMLYQHTPSDVRWVGVGLVTDLEQVEVVIFYQLKTKLCTNFSSHRQLLSWFRQE